LGVGVGVEAGTAVLEGAETAEGNWGTKSS